MAEKSYIVKSRRYFDQENIVEKVDKKVANLIVFEGAIDRTLLQQIIAFFINKYKSENHKVAIINQPVLPQKVHDQMKNPLNYFVTMCRLTGEWYDEKVKPALDKGNLVLLDHYYHRYLTNAMVMEIQRAQQKMQKQMEKLEQRGEPMPEQMPPLEVDSRLIVELQEQYTDAVPEPDVLFACFDDSDMQSAFIKKAFNSLFSTESYIYPINTFYGLKNIVKEMEVRLNEYKIGG